jgi:GTP-binding protein
MIKIRSVTLEKRCRNPREFPKSRLPEVAFAGRSNVGKSSLINSLLNRKALVKVSGQPGKTRSIDFFLINGRFRLVDLPGYGYANVPVQMRNDWKYLIENYLKHQNHLVSVVWILDIRREVGELDRMLEEWLRVYGIPYIPVCTKADKIAMGTRGARVRRIAESLSYETEPLLFSSKTGLGRALLWKGLLQSISSFAEGDGWAGEPFADEDAE